MDNSEVAPGRIGGFAPLMAALLIAVVAASISCGNYALMRKVELDFPADPLPNILKLPGLGLAHRDSFLVFEIRSRSLENPKSNETMAH